ncbi:MAG: uracil-DNA glycosylase family protein [Bacteroidaceae bacterium]
MKKETNEIPVEHHPLTPFLPKNARMLMLGSFPPQKKRWSMDFYYPNLQNDMWRIFGLIFFGNKDYFVEVEAKRFRKDEIIKFLQEQGIALYDTASTIRRLQENASDKFLDIVIPTDVPALLRKIPFCQAIVTTGQKASSILSEMFEVKEPKVGESVSFMFEQRSILFYRMPSSSRAYPLALNKKAALYEQMCHEIGFTSYSV